MYKLIYAEEADNDLTAIFNYIADDSRERAVDYLGKMESCILQLKDFPNIGVESRYKELRALGIKILPFENYLIFHTVNNKENTVNIIRVLRGSVNYRKLF